MTHFRPPHGPRSFVRSRFALPALVAVVQVVGTLLAHTHEPARRDLDPAGVALLLAGPIALTMRGRRPVPVLLAVFGVTCAYELLGYIDGPVFLSLAIAVVAAIVLGRRLAAVAVVAVGYVAFVWGESLIGLERPPELPEAVGVGAWLVALLTVPEVVRGRRERFAEAMRTRAEERRRRASEERLRIARELHDTLAHNISLINVQASSALHLLDEQPEQARPALAAIKDASNHALGELKSVLDVLRQGDLAPRAPTAGIADLDNLIARTELAGLRVSKQVRGRIRPLPAALDQAAFRIVQEALTNVARHADDATGASIALSYGDDELVVEVDDDGRGAASSGDPNGKGIAGMGERARALGGEVEAGPLRGGGFRVRARLPYDALAENGS